MKSLAASLALFALATAGCKVVHYDVCDMGPIIIMPPTPDIQVPPPRHAQALYVLDLDRAASNLAGPYAGMITRLNAELSGNGVIIDRYAVLPLYGGVTGAPALIYGEPAPLAGDLSTALASAALSGFFDAPLNGATAEQFNLAAIASSLDTATLPPELTTGETRPFFGPPDDLFLIVTVHAERRLCALTDPACTLQGQPPLAYFSSTNMDGTAAWLRLPAGSYPKSRVYQVFLTTGEAESPSDFRARCSAVPGFPKGLLDVMEPSPTIYYRDLAAGLAAASWHAERVDVCDALGAGGPAMIRALAQHAVASGS